MTFFWSSVYAAADVVPSEFLGPTAALAVALVAVGVLWREDRKSGAARIADKDLQIADLKADRDLNRDGWKAQTDANAKLAEAWEARNRAEDGRRRGTDRG
jgi:hypothetical protein